MRLPLDVGDLLRSRTRLTEDREQPVRIAVFVDVEAPNELVEAVREAMRPQTSGARIHVEVCAPGETLLVDATVDAVVALAGLGATLDSSLVAARDKFVPTVVLALDQNADAVSLRLSHPLLDTIGAGEPEQVIHALGRWLVDRLNGKRLAMATNFSFMRRAVSEEAIKATSFQNGVVGLVMVIPGADMPVMTANQAKMVLQIAAAYGQTLGAERIKELAVVLGGGFAFRAIARQALAFIPGFGWAVKAGIGYTGTMAMGYAALEHFEAGGEMGALAAKVKGARDRVIEAAQARSGRGESGEEILEANGYVVVSESPRMAPVPEPVLPPSAAPATPSAQDGAGAQ
jgi:uncharacterized protein (DUF697 family)